MIVPLAVRQATDPSTGDNTIAARTSYAAISLLCMLTMAGFLGSRFHQVFDKQYWKRMKLIHSLPFMLYFFGIAFDLSAAVTVAGMGLRQETMKGCKGAMYVCLVFYCATKITVQLFLIERAHAVKKQMDRRIKDTFYTTFAGVIIVGFGTIAILAFIAPVGIVDEGDGQCRIGLPRKAVMVLMVYDILINLILTGAFLIKLHPLFRLRSRTVEPIFCSKTSIIPLRSLLKKPDFATTRFFPSRAGAPFEDSSSSSSSLRDPFQAEQPRCMAQVIDPNVDHLKRLVKKTIYGTIIMLTATIINLSLLIKYNGQEHGWICFMCCLIDITWTVIIVSLLTEGRKETIRPSLVTHRRWQQRPIETDVWTQLAHERAQYNQQQAYLAELETREHNRGNEQRKSSPNESS